MKRILPIFLCAVFSLFVVGGVKPQKVFASEEKTFRLMLGDVVEDFTETDIGYKNQFGFTAQELLKKIKGMGIDEADALNYIYPKLSIRINEFAKRVDTEPQESVMIVTSGTPEIMPEKTGLKVNTQKAISDIYSQVWSDVQNIVINMEAVDVNPSITVADNQKLMHTKAEFVTYINGENQEGRINNIKVALEKVNGFMLPAGETFSFNTVVGETSADNGFMLAKVILNGEFVDDYGGGVCQAATTIYNAALLAGLEIKKVRPHSLKVGYVLGSFDAMVSSSSDLVIKNPYDYPVYFYASANNTEARVKIFGAPNEFTIERRNNRLEIDETKDSLIAYKSEGYLDYYKDGILIESKKIRTDAYKKLQQNMALQNE